MNKGSGVCTRGSGSSRNGGHSLGDADGEGGGDSCHAQNRKAHEEMKASMELNIDTWATHIHAWAHANTSTHT